MVDPDRRLVEQSRRLYAPEPPGPGRRAALRAGVEARVRSRPRSWLVAAAIGAVLVLALAALLVQRPVPAPAVGHGGHSTDRWVEDVLFGAEQEEVPVPLPAEYAALSELLER